MTYWSELIHTTPNYIFTCFIVLVMCLVVHGDSAILLQSKQPTVFTRKKRQNEIIVFLVETTVKFVARSEFVRSRIWPDFFGRKNADFSRKK